MKIFFHLLWLPVLIAVTAACSSTGANTGANTIADVSQNVPDDAAIELNRKLLEANPAHPKAREDLKQLVDRTNAVPNEQSRRVRDILRLYAQSEKVSLVRKEEPGEPLLVSGTLRDAAGQPVAGALLYVFQTDAEGHYTRTAVMNEANSRLFAFIKTDREGRFEFNTIRPGGYPGAPGREGEQWRIPQHIHFQVTAEGYQFRNLQMVFQDDPRMTPYWHEWARKGHHPVATVNRNREGVQHAVCDVILQSNSSK